MLSAMFMVFLGRISDIFKSLRWVCLLRTVVIGDPTQNIAYFFMYVIIQELLNMNVLVSEIDLNIQWIIASVTILLYVVLKLKA